jgi:HD-GYP domain-containing protein (c-di-GMP phosphodiesterase class II)
MLENYEIQPGKTPYREKTRVPVTHLTIGMFICELDRPWLDSPFLIQGFLLNTQQKIIEVQRVCRYVYIDVVRQKVTNDATGETKIRTRYVEKVSFQQEIAYAKITYDDAKSTVEDIYRSIRMGSSFTVEGVKQIVSDSVASIIRNPDAMLWLTLLKNHEESLSEHSLHSCILAIILGRAEGLLEVELEKLGICGLLFDVGKAKIPEQILTKTGKLTPEEVSQLKMHPIYGRKLLMSKRELPPIAVDVAFCHHERLDGKGYPRGIASYQIPYFAKIVGIVDTYMAMTHKRSYRGACSTLTALKAINERRDHFDGRLIVQLVKAIGIYPIGCIAELSDGELGIVLPTDQENRMKPRILIVRSDQHQKVGEYVVDLKNAPTNADGHLVKIKKLHADGSYGIEFKDYSQHKLVLGES